MKKKKSLHGFLADKNNPISMDDILREEKNEEKREREKERKELRELAALQKRKRKGK